MFEMTSFYSIVFNFWAKQKKKKTDSKQAIACGCVFCFTDTALARDHWRMPLLRPVNLVAIIHRQNNLTQASFRSSLASFHIIASQPASQQASSLMVLSSQCAC